ncbi:MAG: cobalamin-dependent protein, partial [Gemmatimonadetes bacterium]|nr:cobalamin-dependent protein [Gemmatimonadota bacterium]
MRILLIQPPQGTKFGFTKILLVEPLGLECVGAALEQSGHEVEIVDLRLDPFTRLRQRLTALQPRAVGLSCGFTTDVYTTLHAARAARDALPRATIFVGGHHASLVPGDFVFPGSPVDAVVIGEGESTAQALADTIERGDPPASVPGVVTLDTPPGGFRARPFPATLDELPLPARTLTLRYRKRYHHGYLAPSACVETSRGCPFNCNFCSIWVFYQRRALRRSPERILLDLEAVRRLGERHVFFTDDIAFLQREAYEELGLAIRDAKLGMRFTCETRADLVVKYADLFRLWREIGMTTIFLGIEKIDDDGLGSVRKRTKGGAATNLEAIRILREAGITPMTSLITDPAWGEEDFDRLESFVRRLDLPNPTFSILTPLPGTELWEARKHEITTTDYAYFDVMHLVLPTQLPHERFYERFAGLYRHLTERRLHINRKSLRELAGLILGGRGFAVRRVLSAMRDMIRPRNYLAHPGRMPRPDFVPPD